ncbi:MAG: hypothetical protein PHF46_03225 [Candidatus Gracilibacteria bacterium]|nr:hypothetical protein [Candidatus Gracilibacteria bacterium]MDD3120391.1 hypothetical protein [Candidatus Gracilibacteria bacterium]
MENNFEFNQQKSQNQEINQKDLSKKEIDTLEELENFLDRLLIITNEEEKDIIEIFKIAKTEGKNDKQQKILDLCYGLKNKQDYLLEKRIKEDPNFYTEIKELLQKNQKHALIIIETMEKINGLKNGINCINNDYNLI